MCLYRLLITARSCNDARCSEHSRRKAVTQSHGASASHLDRHASLAASESIPVGRRLAASSRAPCPFGPPQQEVGRELEIQAVQAVGDDQRLDRGTRTVERVYGGCRAPELRRTGGIGALAAPPAA